MVHLHRERSIFVPLVVTSFVLAYAGCGPANVFRGRLIVLNSTGGPITSVTLKYEKTQVDWLLNSSDMASGLGVECDCRQDELAVLGPLILSWVDGSGVKQRQVVPFEGAIPDLCDDDFLIEIDGGGRARSGLEVHYGKSDHHFRLAIVFLVGLFTGLILARWLFRRSRSGEGEEVW